ncbi:MAG: alpha/beta hydrolase [Symbiobacteriaceae bacterium]|nr:alpha/beta hydrolase [Symbiobacteriaceae bacterium]
MLIVSGGLMLALLTAGFVYEQVARLKAKRRPLPGRLVEMGGHRIHLTDSGAGGPTVVVIHGAGESCFSWVHVAREVASFARVVTYDRPGLGGSDPGPGPDATRSPAELHMLLAKAGLPGPYVLVGHSLGGVIARLYAIRYPDEVAGMVLVDSTHEFLKDDRSFRQSFAVIGLLLRVFRFCSAFGLPRFLGEVFGFFPMYPERRFFAQQVTRDEYRDWTGAVCRNLNGEAGLREFAAAMPILEEASRQMQSGAGGPQFGDMPLVVLTNPGNGEGWIEMQRELASRSANSIHRVSDRPGHNLQMVRPELVVEGIGHVVEQVRSWLLP